MSGERSSGTFEKGKQVVDIFGRDITYTSTLPIYGNLKCGATQM
jgi:hypothetical protein